MNPADPKPDVRPALRRGRSSQEHPKWQHRRCCRPRSPFELEAYGAEALESLEALESPKR